MSIGNSQNGGGAGGPAPLPVDHVRVSKTPPPLTARLGGELIHQDVINVNGAAARGRFAEKVAQKLGVDQQEVEEQLLAIAAELAELYDEHDGQGAGSAQYQFNDDHEDPEQRGLYC